MARPLRHPSGAAQVVTVRLSPDCIRHLDAAATSRSLSRSELIEKTLWRVPEKLAESNVSSIPEQRQVTTLFKDRS